MVNVYLHKPALFHLKHGECSLSVLSAQNIRRLSLGVSVLDDIFPGFEAGNFAVLHGNSATFISFLLCVRAQLSFEKSGLGSSVVFVDGGNSFSPYMVAGLARDHGLDTRAALENICVSRAFTAYQLSSLILEKLEPFLRSKKAKLLVVSDVSSLFFDKDIPKTEAKDLFIKTCAKLSDIAVNKQTIVIATYFPDRRSKRGVFFEAVLIGRSNVLIRFKRKGRILTLILEDHPYIKPFTMEFPADYTTLTDFMEV
jgi:RecA/RadA recombinase